MLQEESCEGAHAKAGGESFPQSLPEQGKLAAGWWLASVDGDAGRGFVEVDMKKPLEIQGFVSG
jgi:hypothetical protein